PELQCSAAGWTRPSGLRTRLTELPGSAAACIFERSRKPHNPSPDLGVLEQTSPGRWLTPRALMAGTRPQYLQFPHPWRAESPRRVCGVSVRLYFMRNVRRGEGSKVFQKRKKSPENDMSSSPGLPMVTSSIHMPCAHTWVALCLRSRKSSRPYPWTWPAAPRHFRVSVAEILVLRCCWQQSWNRHNLCGRRLAAAFHRIRRSK